MEKVSVTSNNIIKSSVSSTQVEENMVKELIEPSSKKDGKNTNNVDDTDSNGNSYDESGHESEDSEDSSIL